MNTMIKVGIASALAMGYASAHASIVIPGSTNGAPSDVVLFAEVVSGSTVLGSYAGDTGVAVGTALTSSNLKISNSDSNLQSLLTLGASAGNTIEWAVLGGQFAFQGSNTAGDQYLTTLTTGASSLNNVTAGNYGQWSTILNNTLVAVQTNAGGSGNVGGGGANSVFASTAAKGSVWDGTTGLTTTANLANWSLNGADNVITGTSTSLYEVTTTPALAGTVATLGTLSLTASGLSYTPAGSGSPVPLPAAIWLLGSGLLGLAGVGRRKASAAV
jgi:hypothetical protein